MTSRRARRVVNRRARRRLAVERKRALREGISAAMVHDAARELLGEEKAAELTLEERERLRRRLDTQLRTLLKEDV